MNIKEFVSSTIMELEKDALNQLVEKLTPDYMSFSYIDKGNISKEIFSEKVYDFFEKTEIKTGDKFEKTFERYVSELNEVVKCFIPNVKDGDPPRSLKYYKRAQRIKIIKNMNQMQADEYTRIMLSLYMGAIKREKRTIYDYSFSISDWDLEAILNKLKGEKVDVAMPIIPLPMGKKDKYKLDSFSTDAAIFVIIIIMFYHIQSLRVEGE